MNKTSVSQVEMKRHNEGNNTRHQTWLADQTRNNMHDHNKARQQHPVDKTMQGTKQCKCKAKAKAKAKT